MNVFIDTGGWITDHRTLQDYAQCMKDLVEFHFPAAEVIRVVQDNLNAHTP